MMFSVLESYAIEKNKCRGICPEWQLRWPYETEGERQKLSWVKILLTLRNRGGPIAASRLCWPYEAEGKAQNLSWMTYAHPRKLRGGTWFEPLLSMAVSKNSYYLNSIITWSVRLTGYFFFGIFWILVSAPRGLTLPLTVAGSAIMLKRRTSCDTHRHHVYFYI